MQNPSASWNDGIPAFRTRQRRSTDGTSVSGVSEVIFRASRKPRSTPEEWRQSAPGGRRL
uniref:hypothetical protein n=1 Tax=Bacteroides uniformis TaxID=820 RepID=UPI0040266286